mmetsp:Transcript_16984/g.43486  ORF Transcript_16984/g.43486 Transcript_16984/m.43486 type:complete len:527 (-) Transcript_16984:290-1870(-)
MQFDLDVVDCVGDGPGPPHDVGTRRLIRQRGDGHARGELRALGVQRGDKAAFVRDVAEGAAVWRERAHGLRVLREEGDVLLRECRAQLAARRRAKDGALLAVVHDPPPLLRAHRARHACSRGCAAGAHEYEEPAAAGAEEEGAHKGHALATRQRGLELHRVDSWRDFGGGAKQAGHVGPRRGREHDEIGAALQQRDGLCTARDDVEQEGLARALVRRLVEHAPRRGGPNLVARLHADEPAALGEHYGLARRTVGRAPAAPPRRLEAAHRRGHGAPRSRARRHGRHSRFGRGGRLAVVGEQLQRVGAAVVGHEPPAARRSAQGVEHGRSVRERLYLASAYFHRQQHQPPLARAEARDIALVCTPHVEEWRGGQPNPSQLFAAHPVKDHEFALSTGNDERRRHARTRRAPNWLLQAVGARRQVVGLKGYRLLHRIGHLVKQLIGAQKPHARAVGRETQQLVGRACALRMYQRVPQRGGGRIVLSSDRALELRSQVAPRVAGEEPIAFGLDLGGQLKVLRDQSVGERLA